MNFDIRLSMDFYRHKKTKMLIKRLGFEAVCRLQMLWIWAAEYQFDGILKGQTKEDIELIVDWDGEPGAFVDALISIGWLSDDNGEYSIHGWEERQAYAIKSEERSNIRRFSRLIQVNKDAYNECVIRGISALSPEEYEYWKNWNRQQQDGNLPENTGQLAGNSPANFGNSPANCQQNLAPINQVTMLTSSKSFLREGEKISPSPSPDENVSKEKSIPDEYTAFAREYQQAVLDAQGECAPKITEKLIRDGAEEVEKAVRIDGFAFDELQRALWWAKDNDFWSSNVLSLGAIRKKKDGVTKIQKIMRQYRQSLIQRIPQQRPPGMSEAERRTAHNDEVGKRVLAMYQEAKRRAGNGE